MLKKLRWPEILSALVLTVFGIVLLAVPKMALITVSQSVGVVLMLIGLVFLLAFLFRRRFATGRNELAKGVVFGGLGIFIFFEAELVVSIIPVIMGIVVAISGVMKLQRALDLRKMKFSTWSRVGITALINILIGLLVVINPFQTVEWVVQLIGICFIFSGVSDLVTTLYVSGKAARYYVDATVVEEVPPENAPSLDREDYEEAETIEDTIYERAIEEKNDGGK